MVGELNSNFIQLKVIFIIDVYTYMYLQFDLLHNSTIDFA